MATTKIKFPQYSHSQMLKLIYDRDATREVRIEDSSPIERGQFVIAWDSDVAADDYPVLGALCSLTLKRYGELSYNVLCEGGYHVDYKHVRIVEPQHLPSVVTLGFGGLRNGASASVGKLIGFYFDDNDEPFVTVLDKNGAVNLNKPENIAYLEDVKFGIVKEEADG